MPTIWFVDTSVLCELLEVPGKCDKPDELKAEARKRRESGDRFVLPITAVIESGNHISQSGGDRRGAAGRFVKLIDAVRDGNESWALHEVAWDSAFLNELTEGSVTAQPFVDLAGTGQMGAGDLAILIERERFKSRGAFTDVRIWTLDQRLGAYS